MISYTKNMTKLPASILNQIDKIVVNRQGKSSESYMRTEDIPGYVEPLKTYFLSNTCSEKLTHNPFFEQEKMKNTCCFEQTPYCQFEATWEKEEFFPLDDSNILGGFGTLLLHENNKTIFVPVVLADMKNLALFGSTLIQPEDPVVFQTNQFLPITVTHIGPQYVNDYLMQQDAGHGVYLEYHDEPHLWIPLDEGCSGHVVLGRQAGPLYQLTAFQIPFGCAIYTSPFVLHCDAFLVGRFMVVYTVAQEYSSVILKNKEKELVHLEFKTERL